MADLPSFLALQTARHATCLALQSRPRYRTVRWTYRDLAARVGLVASNLRDRGVVSGDRVLLFAENSLDWVAAFFGILARGAVVIPLNPKSPTSQLERIVAVAEPKLVIASPHSVWPVTGLPRMAIDASFDTIQSPDNGDGSFGLGGELAEIIYTSGTTGDPKGVMLSHANLLGNLEGVQAAVPLQPQDQVLTLLPLFHVFGQMTGILCPLRAGASVTYLAAPTSRAILEALAHTPATHLVVIPEVLRTMMERLEARLGRLPGWSRPLLRARIRRRLSPTLRTIVCGGAPLDAELEEKWWALGFEVLQGYGLTETSPVIAANTVAAHRSGTVGRPIAGVTVRIAGDGEIQVRGPGVMQGYFRDPVRTAKTFDGDWLRTGDGGRLDGDGFLHVFGRRKYMILGPSGENVFPEDIEAELNRIPGVIDSAVVGLDRNGRTIVHAVLICETGAAAASVAAANRHLAPHQQITSWSLWPEADFPRSVTRKVRKDDVIRRLAEHAAAAAEPGGRHTPLRRLIAELTGTPLNALSDTMRPVADLNLDSLLRLELVARIEDTFGVALQEVEIMPTMTLAELENRVERQPGLATTVVRYPRWSLSAWACALRPAALAIFVRSWLQPFCRLRISGLEHLADVRGPVLFMANHGSYLDSAVASFALPQRMRLRLAIAASTEVLYRRFPWAVPLGELALNAFPFPTGADENIRPGLEYIGRLLDDGWNVLIFPEGQMNRTDQPLLELKGGTGLLASEMAVPIVPVAIRGTAAIMPPGRMIPQRRATVDIRFGSPIQTSGGTRSDVLTERVRTALETLLAS